MAKFVVGNGIDEYLTKLRQLSDKADDQIGKAVYEGAKVVADAVRSSIDNIPVNNDKSHKHIQDGISEEQKQGLVDGFGIAKMQNDSGFQHVKLGFYGYNSKRTPKYQSGQPNLMIARMMESGNSFTRKNPVISKAVRSSKGNAEKQMAKIFDKEIEKLMK